MNTMMLSTISCMDVLMIMFLKCVNMGIITHNSTVGLHLFCRLAAHVNLSQFSPSTQETVSVCEVKHKDTGLFTHWYSHTGKAVGSLELGGGSTRRWFTLLRRDCFTGEAVHVLVGQSEEVKTTSGRRVLLRIFGRVKPCLCFFFLLPHLSLLPPPVMSQMDIPHW